jgi:hypothetical protein
MRVERIQWTDDIDDQPIPDGQARRFICSFGDSEVYELDVSPEHHDAIRAALQPFLGQPAKPTRKRAAGGKAKQKRTAAANGKPARKAPPKAVTLDAGQRAAIRLWAAAQGRQVPARGKLPAALVDEYVTAHA